MAKVNLLKTLQKLFCQKQKNEIERLEQVNQELRQKLESKKREEWPDLTTKVVDQEKVEDVLSDLDQWDQRESYWYDDGKYRVPNIDDFEAVARRDSTDEREYVADYFDCDNYSEYIIALFARRYRCNSVGIVMSPDAEPPHAFNVVIVEVDGDIEARLWEPQTDEWVLDESDPKYTLDGAMIHV